MVERPAYEILAAAPTECNPLYGPGAGRGRGTWILARGPE